jgi:hypothetical protein
VTSSESAMEQIKREFPGAEAFTHDGMLGEIAGLGARSISEIEAGLVLAGLVLDAGTPAPQPLHTCRATEPARATTAGDARSFHGPGRENRRRGSAGG